jgi:hypothetical protein
MLATDAGAQQSRQVQGAITSPLEPLRQDISEDQLFSELQAHNEQRKTALLGYTVRRTYRVSDVGGKVHAEEVGRMEFRAPDQKDFVVTSEGGSNLIRHMALGPLISSEIETAAGKEHHDSSISPANYQLHLVGEQQLGRCHCFVADVVPKRKDKYLFEGRAWIDAEDCAIVRIEGHPAKKLSFWIERAEFVRQYQKVDGFWLPLRDETTLHVRLYGDKRLTIDHADYAIHASRNGGTYVSEATARVATSANAEAPSVRDSSRFLQNKKGVE